MLSGFCVTTISIFLFSFFVMSYMTVPQNLTFRFRQCLDSGSFKYFGEADWITGSLVRNMGKIMTSSWNFCDHLAQIHEYKPWEHPDLLWYCNTFNTARYPKDTYFPWVSKLFSNTSMCFTIIFVEILTNSTRATWKMAGVRILIVQSPLKGFGILTPWNIGRNFYLNLVLMENFEPVLRSRYECAKPYYRFLFECNNTPPYCSMTIFLYKNHVLGISGEWKISFRQSIPFPRSFSFHSNLPYACPTRIFLKVGGNKIP